MQLNPEQIEAVRHVEGPLLILAGAGSGKTRVIVHRIAHLIREKGVLPSRILAVTFTNKAAEEMKSRVQHILGGRSADVWISTFHSSCVKILRHSLSSVTSSSERRAAGSGLPPDRSNFVIYDDSDSMTLVKECLHDLRIDEKMLSPRGVHTRIQSAKNDLVGPDAYAMQVDDFFATRVAEIYRLYQKKLAANNALDFGDLIFRAVELLQKNPQILESDQDRFQYIMIDEYQDTNRAQYILTKILAAKHRNLCVVGDPDQSVYRWRGADIQNILNFESDYAGCKVVKLEQNYRSTQNILTIANNVIGHNSGRKGKTLWTENLAGEKAMIYVAKDEKDEARYVISEIMRRQQEGRKYNDFAIFYRTNAQSRIFEDELRKNRVPYIIFGGVRFYDRKEIKDLLSYVRILVNPRDSLNLKRIINVPPRGLGAKAIEHLENLASEKDITLYEAAGRADEIADMASTTRNRIRDFYRKMENLKTDAAEGKNVAALIQRILEETGYAEMLEREKTVESENRLENLGELLTVADDFDKSVPETSAALFLDQVALVGQTDTYDPEKGILPMMTLHLAKGLEFPVVFMVGLEEGLFPHSRSLDQAEELEEERRLCYVGMTRAREKLTLTLAERRRLYGGEQFNLPSRFLNEIPEALVEKIENKAPRFSEFEDSYASDDFDQREDDERLKIGSSVQHPTFGRGVIKRREGKGEQEKVTVYFHNGQIKTLMVKFANLTPEG